MAIQKKRIRLQAAQFPVPQSKDEAIEAIAEIGRKQRERARIQAAMNDEMAGVKQRYEDQATPHNEAIHDLTRGVHAWCEANRDSLTQGGKVKHASLASGQIRWRTTPPKVSIRGAEAVLELLRRLGLKRFVRSREEISKEAILAETKIEAGKIVAPADLAAVPGITVTQSEDFVIVPFETELEEVA